MSRGRSSNDTRNIDQRSTEVLNAGISGGVQDSAVVSGNTGPVNLVSRRDESTNFIDLDTSRRFEDYSDNSLQQDFEDNSVVDLRGSLSVGDGSTYTDSSARTTNTTHTTNITDGGAFKLVGDTNRDTFSFLRTLLTKQQETFNAANDLASRSVDNAFAIKAGEELNKRATNDLQAQLATVAKVAAFMGIAYVGAKAVS